VAGGRPSKPGRQRQTPERRSQSASWPHSSELRHRPDLAAVLSVAVAVVVVRSNVSLSAVVEGGKAVNGFSVACSVVLITPDSDVTGPECGVSELTGGNDDSAVEPRGVGETGACDDGRTLGDEGSTLGAPCPLLVTFADVCEGAEVDVDVALPVVLGGNVGSGVTGVVAPAVIA
jgi:hypothetical protein